MPTIRAQYPITINAEVVVARDFHLNRERQVAKALYEQLMDMSEDDAIDFLLERLTVHGEGQPQPEGESS